MSDIDTLPVEPHDISSTLSGLADSQNPWLGLDSFTEETRRFFHGRDAEIAELARRVQRKLLTILFGQSGLGKTSILRAGIVPRLRRDGYCPVYVRIDYSASSPAPSEQIKQAIFVASASWGHWSRPGTAVAGESLWEFLHHRDDVLRTADAKALTPLLIFDQFEELFTLAQGDDFGRRRAAEFIEELADLVENRAPKALESKLDRDDTIAERFDFDRADYRILIALREDYLAHLEGLKGDMPSITQNRMRLARMTGKQALDAVMKPGGDLVSQEVAESIVRFVAGDAELVNAEVEPALLSLVCRELNNARVAQGRREISAEVLAGSHDSILHEFYERALADQPPGVRRFIEDQMLTESGYRENLAEERVLKAFAAAGAAPTALATLVNRRLLRVEERLDMRRVELTHDVLGEVVQRSRDLRQQRETRESTERQLEAQAVRELATRRALRKARQVAVGCAVLAIVAVGSAIFGYQNMKRAQQAEGTALRTHQMAEAARAEAEKLIVYMLDDLYLELEPVGRLDVVGELSKRALDYYAALPPELRNSETNRNRALALARSGYVLSYQGKQEEAGTRADEAIGILDGLRRGGDASEITAIGLSLGLSAKAHSQGQRRAWAEAEATLANAQAVLQPFMSGPQPSVRLKRAYGGVMGYRGYAQESLSLLEPALKSLEGAREAYRSIDDLALGDLSAAAGFAEDSAWQSRILHSLGRDEDSERVAREGARVAGQILERRPGHMPALRSHALNLGMLADLAASQSHIGKALPLVRDEVRDWENFAKLDPGNFVAADNLSMVRVQMAELLESAGRPTESLEKYREAFAVDPGASALTFSLVLNVGQSAKLEADMGLDARLAKTLQNCRSLARIAARNVANTDFQQTLVLNSCSFFEGWAALNGGNYPHARDVLQEYIRRFESLKPADRKEKEDSRFVLEWAHGLFANALYYLGDYAGAEREMQRSFGYGALRPARTMGQRVALSSRRILLADAIARQGRSAEASKIIEPELKFQRELVAGGSDDRLQHVILARALIATALASAERAHPLLREAAAIVDGLPPDMKRRKSVLRLRSSIAEEMTTHR